MSNNTKTTFFDFLPRECLAVEEYLELMAEKGWLLQSNKGYFFKFKKIEPQNIKYSVDVIPKASIFGPIDSDLALKYREYCQAAGWEYICQNGVNQIFYAVDYKSVTSIYTGDEEKFKSVFKASLYSWVKLILYYLIIFLSNYFITRPAGNFDITIESNSQILFGIAAYSVLFISIAGIIPFFLWAIRSKGRLKENKSVLYSSYKNKTIKNILIKSYGLIILILLLKFSDYGNEGSKELNFALLIVVFVPIIIFSIIKKFNNRKTFSKNINTPITICSNLVSIYLVLMIMCNLGFSSITAIEQNKGVINKVVINKVVINKVVTDKVKLTLVDFGYKENDEVSPSISQDNSVLAQSIDYFNNNEEHSLSYSIFQSQYPWVIKEHKGKFLKQHILNGVDFKLMDTNLPGNIEVYSDSEKTHYVLISEDKLVDIAKDAINISEDAFLNKVYKKLFP
ncbi:DUF2812 domain-containing protein [Clostridium lacusfryxellense]|uniref:DUF2812 domain-containing protein n=1 Tax=Clostridium lacusfryxellense TaxID=205328 RepID=UPI001C0CF984|nr:DUF2812 domain-containing protein [Clostridium lacusfryxellense]MBU3110620.1 DUF2812 domain-containing protein [Clostridium lacusfryxellense]